jgi:preprotein translocase subunit YajC
VFYIFPVAVAYAEQAPSPGASGIASILPLLILFAIFYFLLIRPQRNKMKEHKEMLGKLSQGDNVITNGGIHGRITSIGEETVSIEVANNVKIKVSKEAVSSRKPRQ